MQQFIAGNPVLLHQFPAQKIFIKPSIIGLFNADFAILTTAKELLLVELEKPNTQLMKRDGGIAAPLNHAFDQVREWLHIVDEHRLAVLEALGLEKHEVSSIRGVVIVGRHAGYDADHLRRLKGADWGRAVLFTYDDLVSAMDALIRTFGKL